MSKKVVEALNWASCYLQAKGREETAAEWLLCHVLETNRTGMLSQLHAELTDDSEQLFTELVVAHGDGEPVQYLLGYEYFYGRKFIVNPEVLIPRMETEELVQAVLQRLPNNEKQTLVDVGTGSGVIAITLALEAVRWQVSAIDIAQESLLVAEENAQRLQATVDFKRGNLLEPLIKQQIMVDAVISNPPYISIEDYQALDTLVREKEPQRALLAGEDGLDFYRQLVKEIPFVLNEPGFVAFEVGVGQSRAVATLLEASFAKLDIEIINDINGKDRIVIAKIFQIDSLK